MERKRVSITAVRTGLGRLLIAGVLTTALMTALPQTGWFAGSHVAFASYSSGGLYVSDPGQCNGSGGPTGSPAVGQQTCVLANYGTTTGQNPYICYSVSSANSTGAYTTCHICTFIAPGQFGGSDFSCKIPPVGQGYTVSYYVVVANNSSPTISPTDSSIFANQGSGNAISYSFTGTAAAYSRFHARTTAHGELLTWYSPLHVLGFNIFDGKQRINHRLITSRTHWYRFQSPHRLHRPRLVAVYASGTHG